MPLIHFAKVLHFPQAVPVAVRCRGRVARMNQHLLLTLTTIPVPHIKRRIAIMLCAAIVLSSTASSSSGDVMPRRFPGVRVVPTIRDLFMTASAILMKITAASSMF